MANIQTGFVPEYVSSGGVQTASRDKSGAAIASGVASVASELMGALGKSYREEAKAEAALDKEQRMELFKIRQADIAAERKKGEERKAGEQQLKAWGLVAKYRQLVATQEEDQDKTAKDLYKGIDKAVYDFINEVGSLDLSSLAGPDGKGISSFIEAGIKEIKSGSDMEKVMLEGGHMRIISPLSGKTFDFRAPKTADEWNQEVADQLKIYAPGLFSRMQGEVLTANGNQKEIERITTEYSDYLNYVDNYKTRAMIQDSQAKDLDNKHKLGLISKQEKEAKTLESQLETQKFLKENVRKTVDGVIARLSKLEEAGQYIDGEEESKRFIQNMLATIPSDELIDKDIYNQIKDEIEASGRRIAGMDSKTKTQSRTATLEAERNLAREINIKNLDPELQALYTNAPTLKLIGDIMLTSQILGPEFNPRFTAAYNTVTKNYKEIDTKLQEFKDKWGDIKADKPQSGEDKATPKIPVIPDEQRKAIVGQLTEPLTLLDNFSKALSGDKTQKQLWDNTVSIPLQVKRLSSVLATPAGELYFKTNKEYATVVYSLILELRQQKKDLGSMFDDVYKEQGFNLEEKLIKLVNSSEE